MRQHQIALEMAAKSLGGLALPKLTALYDEAANRLEGTSATSIGTAKNLAMYAECHQPGAKDATVRLIDTETGYYVRLAKTNGQVLMEAGRLILFESLVRDQVNTRAW